MTHEERIKKSIEDAQEAFWASMVESYPEVKSGDFPPDAHIAFENACEIAAKIWLEFNHPDPFFIEG